MANPDRSDAPTDLVQKWLKGEYVYSSSLVTNNQTADLFERSISNSAIFAGRAASYWYRLGVFRDQGAELQAAQAAGKTVSSLRSLWSTIRSIDRMTDIASVQESIVVIGNHFDDTDYHDAKTFIDKDDFWETPIGLGSTYLERHIRNRGLARKFRLGQLVRAEQIMVDAADVAALQFEETLQAVGNLPAPGQPSGSLELWFPE